MVSPRDWDGRKIHSFGCEQSSILRDLREALLRAPERDTVHCMTLRRSRQEVLLWESALLSGCNGHQSLSLSISLGKVSNCQVSIQGSCSPQQSEQYSRSSEYDRGASTRSNGGTEKRMLRPDKRKHPYVWPRICRLRLVPHLGWARHILCNENEEKYKYFFNKNTPTLRWALSTQRWDGRIRRWSVHGAIRTRSSDHFILRWGKEEGIRIHHEQYRTLCRNHCGGLQASMADRALLQVDQTASESKIFPRHLQERGHDADLDCDDLLSHPCIYQVLKSIGIEPPYALSCHCRGVHGPSTPLSYSSYSRTKHRNTPKDPWPTSIIAALDFYRTAVSFHQILCIYQKNKYAFFVSKDYTQYVYKSFDSIFC